MAVIVNETFTNSDFVELSVHDSNWVEHSFSGQTSIIEGNRLRKSSGAGESYYYHLATPADADYTVEADLVAVSTPSDITGVIGRMDTTVATFYLLRMNGGTLQLYKSISGTFTLLGSYVEGFTIGQTKALKLEMIGTAIKGYIGGVERVSVVDSSITAAGKAGVRQSSIDKIHLDNFVVTDSSSAGIDITSNTPPRISLSTYQATVTVVENINITSGVPPRIALTSYQANVALTGAIDITSSTPPRISLSTYQATVTLNADGIITFSGTQALKNNTGTVIANETGLTVDVHDIATGGLIVRKTSLSTDGNGELQFSDPSILAGLTYRVTISKGAIDSHPQRLTAT